MQIYISLKFMFYIYIYPLYIIIIIFKCKKKKTQALEIASECTILSNYQDWWWKERLGKCYFMVFLIVYKLNLNKKKKLGLYRDAEK